MIIVTANKIQAYALQQAKTWPAANIVSWQEAIHLFNEIPSTRLLQAVEQEFIWQQIIEQENTDNTLATESLAQMAQEAWWLSKHWLINWHELTGSNNLNTQWFCKIAKNYMNYCKKHQCIDEAEYLFQLITKPINTQETILYYGFLKLTPLQQKFFDLLQAKPTEQLSTNHLPKDSLYCFENSISELDAASVWATEQAMQNNEQKIAIIVPELSKYRAYLESKFILSQTTFTWKIFSPLSFVDQGLVQTALMILQFSLNKKIALTDLVSLLRSPYFGHMPAEQNERANYLLKLRELQLSSFDWDVALKTAEAWPNLQQQLSQLQKQKNKKSQALSEWLHDWQQLLFSLHFPNRSILTADEMELYKRFEQLLQDFAKLIPWHHKFSASQALNLLTRLCKKTFWDKDDQTESKPTVAILGVIDALNYHFDQAWLTDTTQGNIPFKLFTNALIDKIIQRKHEVWSMTPTIQDELAALCYVQLKNTCQQLTLSYPKENQDQIKNPASFCANWPLITWQTPTTTSQTFIKMPEVAHTLSPWQQLQLPGGSSALKAERLCPMQAFAKHRLNLEEMPEPVLGLTPIERGIIMHRALQLIWQQLQTQQKLLALAEEELTTLITRTTAIALRMVPWSRRKLLPKALLDLESQFLINLLREWLALEATRPPFKIHALEQETHTLFANHKWRLRVDRIDELADGKLLLIDYKTGSTSINHWQLDVFTEPQLPLYVVTNALKIDAIAFAEINAKNLKMTGLAREGIMLGKLGPLKAVDNWDNLKMDWQQALTKLTEAFVTNQADLAPLEGSTTCQRCGLQAFCRVFAEVN